MARYERWVVVAGSLVAACWAAGPNFAAHAEETCLAAPNGAAPEGKHWYYRTAPVQQSKCWHLGPQVAPAPGSQSKPLAPEAGSPSRSPGANADSGPAQRTQPLQRVVRPVASQPPLSRAKSGPYARADVPLPKPAPYRQELQTQHIGPAANSIIAPHATTTSDATTSSAFELSGVANPVPLARAAPSPWPAPAENTTNDAAVGQLRARPESAEVEPQSQAVQSAQQFPAPAVASVEPLNTVAAPDATGTTAQTMTRSKAAAPEPEALPPATNLKNPKLIERPPPSQLMTRLIALILAATKTYSELVIAHIKAIAVGVLWILVLALIVAAALVHRLVNRILRLVRLGTQAEAKLQLINRRAATT
jgi:hypothetical protein